MSYYRSIRNLVEAYAVYDELRWTVEVRETKSKAGKLRWWEPPIACFNSREVALDYARRNGEAAADNGMGLEYRVRERGDDGNWIEVGGLADSGRGVKDRYGRAKA